MTLEELNVLLPCHSLEDLTLSRNRRESDEILSAWSAPYHPAVLARLGQMPAWHSASNPPQEPAGRLILVPHCCDTELPDGWLAKAESAGAVVFRELSDRDKLIAAILERLNLDDSDLEPGLIGSFLALGFCHLQVELITRQLRYMSNLDETQFQRETLAAAESAVSGDEENAKERLTAAFDLLTESREYFYPVETYLIDMTLVAPTTLGRAFVGELADRGPSNLLLSGDAVQELARSQPETLAQLKEAIENERATIIGGEFSELNLPLLPPEAILAQFKRGLDSYERHLGCRPKIFCRRRFGLSPMLPQILAKLGFDGAFHFTLDDGRFPHGNQSKIRWEGLGGASIDALVRLPIDAANSRYFMNLPEKLGDVMDLDHASTAVFAHWPGGAQRWYHDLRRMGEYSPVLGRFTSVDSYFRDTQYVGQSSRHKADQYQSPYLRQQVAAGEPDPVSRWVRYYRQRTAMDAENTIRTLAHLISGKAAISGQDDELGQLIDDATSDGTVAATDLDDQLKQRETEALERFGQSLPRTQEPCRDGILAVNPWSFTRRLCLDVSQLEQLPSIGGPVWATNETEGRKLAIVDVPPMGFTWLGGGTETLTSDEAKKRDPGKKARRRKKKKDDLPLAEENVLRNDFFEVKLDPITGAIRSLDDYTTRGNRLAQQIAFRLPRSETPEDDWEGDESESRYTIMAADEVTVMSAGPIVGRIRVRGRLMDRSGVHVARFTEVLSAQRGSRVLELQIDLDMDRLPGSNPWDSYYAVRFAWGDATADVVRSVNSVGLPTDVSRLEAPYFVDVRSPNVQTTILTGGLPYHRRFGLRKLDSILSVKGDTARSFRLGIGVDLKYPMPAALEFLAPQSVSVDRSPRPGVASSWLFHLDSRNVIATAWEPLISKDCGIGFRVRLLETEGRSSQVGLRSFRSLASAQKVGFLGQDPDDLKIDGDRLVLEMAAHEWVQVEAKFAP